MVATALEWFQIPLRPMALSASQNLRRFSAPFWAMVLAAVIICIRVGEPEFPYFDEIFYVASIHDMSSGLDMGEATHPPLVKVLMLGAIAVFGDAPFSWRLPSAVSGIALVGIVFGVMRTLGSSQLVAVISALLIALDGLCLTQARIAMLNAPCLAFGFGALLLALHRRAGWAGALLGCSVASKFSGLAFIPVILLAMWRTEVAPGERTRGARQAMELIITAMGIYLASFVPLFGFMSSPLSGIIEYHSGMFQHHLRDASIVHRYGSPWWSWPFILRPIWYGFEEVSGHSLVRGVLCIANPFTAMVVLLGLIGCLYRGAISRRMGFSEAIALVGFLSSLLPWAYSPRLTMYHYYYPAYVFGIVLACLQLDSLSSRARLICAAAVCAGCIGMFVYWYPLWTALPISRDHYESMIWFSSWK